MFSFQYIRGIFPLFSSLHSFWWVVYCHFVFVAPCMLGLFTLAVLRFFYYCFSSKIFLKWLDMFFSFHVCFGWNKLNTFIFFIQLGNIFSLLFCPPFSSPSEIPITHVRLFAIVFMLCSFFQPLFPLCFILNSSITIF